MDKIKITDLEIFARHGVMPEETALGQKFIISAELLLSLEKAGTGDRLEDSVNYAEVCDCIKTYNENHTKKLIEGQMISGYKRQTLCDKWICAAKTPSFLRLECDKRMHW